MAYFVSENAYAKQMYTENDIVTMLKFLINVFDNIYVELGVLFFNKLLEFRWLQMWRLCLQTLFLYSYESEFIQQLQRSGAKKTMSFI